MGPLQVNERGTSMTIQLSDDVLESFQQLPYEQQEEIVAVLNVVMRSQAFALASIARGNRNIYNLRARIRSFVDLTEQYLAAALRP
jgi:hypothetical protein